MITIPSIQFDEIQGNIFGGFNKDHAVFILLKVTDAAKARITFNHDTELLKDTAESCSTKVLRFNNQFKALKHAGVPEGSIEATWTNVVFTFTGLEKFGAKGLGNFPQAFVQGMSNRANHIGDNGGNAPAIWNDGMNSIVPWADVDVMILLASDNPSQLDEAVADSRVAKYLAALGGANSGLTVFDRIRGETRMDSGPDQVGHEHFGFKDGVSQPGIRGVTMPDDPLGNPNQGNPGQDLLHPGEFVLGYPRQIPQAKQLADLSVVDGPNPDPGVIAGEEFYVTDPDGSKKVLPAWTKNGSFLVFRRLAQDVKGFKDALTNIAGDIGITEDLLGAKLVGRYKTGAPLEALKWQVGVGNYQPPMTDPGVANPALANSDSLNNDFEYGDDETGGL